MELIRPFSGLGKSDAHLAGGKGASLGEMTQAGIPVPPGFVVLAGAFEYFCQATDLTQEIDAVLHTVKHDEMHTVEHASEKIQALILAAQMPEDIAAGIRAEFTKLGAEYVAVRSSATAEDGAEHAWAGQLDTYLNTPETEVVHNVQRCWASLFTPRAIFYRFEKGLHGTSISVAVVIQKMVQSEISGIAFSVHPVTEDRNQLIIEAGYGLGEAIVSGQVTPDSYVVEKSPRHIIDTNVSTQSRALYRAAQGGNEWRDIPEPKASARVLTEPQVLELAELIIHIEQHYGFPCDIEWAFEAGKFYITQSRPITTLSAAPIIPDLVPEALRIEYVKMGRWAMLPADVETWHTADTARCFHEYFGVWKESLALNIFGAETYNRMFIPKRFVDALHTRIDEILAADPKGLERVLARFYDEKNEMQSVVLRLHPSDLSGFSIEELVAAYEENRRQVHRIVAYDQFGWIAEDYWTPRLSATLQKYGLTQGTPAYHEALFALIKPREISTTLEEKRAVLASVIEIHAARSTIAKEAVRLTTEFGWMPVLAYGTPWDATWYEKELEDAVKKPVDAAISEYQDLVRYTEIRDRDFAATCAKYGISPDDAQLFIDYGLVIDTRNEAEYMNSLCGFHLLPIYAEMARRLACSIDELRTLFEHEIVSCLRGEASVRGLIKQKDGAATCGIVSEGQRIELVGEAARALIEYAEAHCTVAGAQENGDTTRGVPASPGKARGTIRLVHTPAENAKVQTGDILVTFATTVDYLPAMKRATAIVTEVGGLTCHAAVVSREFGIPCVVSYKDAMTFFSDGDVVEVDADRGEVRIISRASQVNLAQEISPERWDYVGLYKAPVFAAWFWSSWAVPDLLAEAELPEAFYGYLAVRGGHACWTHEMKRALEIFTRRKLNEDPDYFARVTKLARREIEEGLKFAATYSLEQPVMELFRLLVLCRTRMQFFWSIGATVSYYFVDELLAAAAEQAGIPQADVASYIPKLDTPMLNLEHEMQKLRQLLGPEVLLMSEGEIAKHIRSQPHLTAAFDSFVREYDWVQETNWLGEPTTLQDFVAILQRQPVDVGEGPLRVASGEFGALCAAAGHIAFWRQGGSEYCSMFEMRTQPILERLAQEAGLSYRDLLRSSPDEILNASSLKDLARIVERRRDDTSAVFTAADGKVHVIDTDAEIAALSSALIPVSDQNVRELKGATGYPGVVRSVVRVIIAREDFDRFKHGEVLVAPMTTPDYVLLMQHAAAIVTDGGGLLCHAAIVSRELKKPCIIGTKIATQVLKDGDMVEVDAEKGVVRIIERATSATPKILSKFFERERPLMYMMVWHDTDEDGLARFTHQSISNGLQIVPPPGQPGSVWYVASELAATEEEALAKINADAGLRAEMIRNTEVQWKKILPYFAEEKKITEVREFMAFYADLCGFWHAMNTTYFRLPDHAELDAEFRAEIFRIRDMTQEYSQRMADFIQHSFEELLPRFAQFSHVVAPQEVPQLAKGDAVLVATLEQRAREGGFILDGEVFPLSDLDAELKKRNLAFEVVDADTKEFTGAIGYTGHAKGIVRIISGRADLGKVEEGEIIVSVLTEPDYLPAMQKAAAFVTDEGGIMSHAAIVAREMKKPCIIGTKIATQVLKDGDMVEVDAEKGIVRKI